MSICFQSAVSSLCHVLHTRNNLLAFWWIIISVQQSGQVHPLSQVFKPLFALIYFRSSWPTHIFRVRCAFSGCVWQSVCQSSATLSTSSWYVWTLLWTRKHTVRWVNTLLLTYHKGTLVLILAIYGVTVGALAANRSGWKENVKALSALWHGEIYM